mmetsp:Transcript_8944/g.32252  ORF Transcript_8944/g.32252 Transcript_8944/m.32252 type:complete len:252 (+) Transcript_8944:799-1554(+)
MTINYVYFLIRPLVFAPSLQHGREVVVVHREVSVVVLHRLPHGRLVGAWHEERDRPVPNVGVLLLAQGVDLQELPVQPPPLQLPTQALAQAPEGLQKPGLLRVREVLHREVVAQRVGGLLHRVVPTATPGADVPHHLREEQPAGVGRQLGIRPLAPLQDGAQGLAGDGGVPVREELAVGLAEGVALVKAVLPGQRLDEVLQAGVPRHVVAASDGALDLEHAGGEDRVEGLKVVSHLRPHRLQCAIPILPPR